MLAKEISRQPSIDYVVWLLITTLLQIYNEKNQMDHGEIRNVQNAWKKEKAPRKMMLESSPMSKEIKKLKV